MEDKPKGQSQEQTGNGKTPQAPTPALADEKEHGQEGENSQHTTNESEPQYEPKTRWQRNRMLAWIFPVRFSNAATLILTLFIMLGTLVSAAAIWLQLKEMEKGGDDTKNLVNYAKQQACAAAKSAQAARDFADTATLINIGIKDAAKKLDTQAGATNTNTMIQAHVAQATVGAHVIPDDWLGMFHRGDHIYALVRVRNYGRAAADLIYIAGKMQILDSAPRGAQLKFAAKDFRAFTPVSLDPAPSFKTDGSPAQGEVDMERRISPSDYPVYRSKMIYVWGVTKYKDFTGQWNSFTFCRSVLASKIFSAGEGTGDGYGSYTPEDCDTGKNLPSPN